MFHICVSKNDGTTLNAKGATMQEAVDKLRGFAADRIDVSFTVAADTLKEMKPFVAALPVALECLAGSSGYKPE